MVEPKISSLCLTMAFHRCTTVLSTCFLTIPSFSPQPDEGQLATVAQDMNTIRKFHLDGLDHYEGFQYRECSRSRMHGVPLHTRTIMLSQCIQAHTYHI
jgi:hypothetical protein